MFTYFAVHIIMVAKMTHLSHGAAMLINMLLNKDCILTKKFYMLKGNTTQTLWGEFPSKNWNEQSSEAAKNLVDRSLTKEDIVHIQQLYFSSSMNTTKSRWDIHAFGSQNFRIFVSEIINFGLSFFKLQKISQATLFETQGSSKSL